MAQQSCSVPTGPSLRRPHGGEDTRHCVVCDASLAGRRRDARHCSGACRADASRLRAILKSSSTAPYRSVRERLDRAQKRTHGLTDPFPRRSTTNPHRRYDDDRQ